MAEAMLRRASIYERIFDDRSGRVPESAIAGG